MTAGLPQWASIGTVVLMLQAHKAPLCWAVTDRKAGNIIQALGLAEALGLEATLKRVRPLPPLSWLPPQLYPGSLAITGNRGPRAFVPPWPDLAIGVGRNAVRPLLALRAASRKAGAEQPTAIVQVQRPTLPASRFDLVIVPRHDGLSGANVIQMQGSIHRVTAARLAAARQAFAPYFATLPKRRLAVLLGGRNKVHRFEIDQAIDLGRSLAALAKREGLGLMITPSRRSDPKVTAALIGELGDVPHRCWDGTGENPYYAILANALAAVVTEDSVNMVTESAAAGLPVLVTGLRGGSTKFARFHKEMREAGQTRSYSGVLDLWTPPHFNEMPNLARQMAARLPYPALTLGQAS